MDAFDEQEAFKDRIGDYPSMNIPDNLSWDKMGPAILKGIEKRKKRRKLLIWMWGIALGFIGFSVIGWWFGYHTCDTNYLMSKLQTVITTTKETHTVSSKNSEKIISNINENRAEKHALTLEEMETQKRYKVQRFTKINKKKRKSTKSKKDTFILVDGSTLPFIQPPENKENLSEHELLKEASSKITRPILSTEMLPTLSSLLFTKNREFIIPPPALIKRATFSPKWQLEMGGGINWWQKELLASNTIDSINTPLIGWQFNARINRHFGKYWSIKLGLQIQNLRYKSDFEHTEGTAIYQPKTVDAIFTNTLTGEQSITYRDSIPGLKTRKFQHFNQHTTLKIPLLAGFTLGKKRWKYSFHTGIGLQFLQYSTGRIALEKGRVTNLPDKRLYPAKVKFSYLFETQLSYQITNNMSVLGSVSMERHFTNWLARDAPFRQHPKIGHSSFGLAWSF